ncbi:type II toxin-antitoxin system RatA family toxin [Haloglomus litoreum]|uniref:type II toxin-antitoxin system RatA family toxin n=1 Tax=Haloglomus litoreum TaxID=3034026 RepID=UPI0023E85F5D|nr:SRPBCC family protein [Haloglomus sp. DT116]
MDGLDVSAVLYAPPEELYDFVTGMRGYAKYSPHLDAVRQYGDGGPGTDYEIVVSWWRLSYTSHTTVTDTDPPERVDWRTTQGLKARGFWRIEPLPEAETPPDREHATRVRLRIQFDPDTLGSVPLAGWTLDRLFDRIKPLVVREAEDIVAGIARDIEGEPRDVDLDIHRSPESV